MGRHSRGILIGLLVAALGVAGCGQSFISSNTEAGKDQERDNGDNTPSVAANYLLVPAGPKAFTVGAGKTAPVKVFLLKKRTGKPAADESVDFEVDSGKSVGSLASRASSTDENGAASVTFRAGQKAGQVEVIASHEQAKPLTFDVTVESEPTGKLRVNLVNTGTSVMPLSDISIRLYDGDQFACADFRPLESKQPDPLEAKVRSRPGTSADFGGLSPDDKYTVSAVARGDRGQIAAGGCKEDLTVPEESVVEEELLLHLIPINPSGRYEATAYYDFSNAIKESGVVGKNIVRVLKLFKNPGDAIYDEIIRLVENLVGGLISQGIDTLLDKTGLDDKFKKTINDAVQNNDTLCRIREIGRDIRDVVANLEVDSELTIGKLGSNYQYQGRNNWLNITVYWRAKCDGAIEKVCSKDKDMNNVEERKQPCAAIHLVPDGTQGKLGDIGVWAEEWQGRVTSYNRLQIRRHPLPLRYGRLIEFLLSEVLLPEMTDGNAKTLAGAFAYWLGCDDLAKSVTGSDKKVCALGQCIKHKDISGFCKTAISTVFGAADLAIGELEYDTGIFVGGRALLVETTSDGRVDYIEDGTYDGYIEVNEKGMSQGRSNISGKWSAERVSSRNVNK